MDSPIIDSTLEETSCLESPDPNEEQICSICNEKYKQPRILSCLHVFCEACLDKMLLDINDDEEEHKTKISPKPIITCTECGQETKVTDKGASGLPLDIVMCSLMDISVIDDMQIVCTSCKAKEKAIARCSDCASFLCPNCVTAHQYMRCFENHKLKTFEEMKNSEEGFQKPVACNSHPGDIVKFFCHTCQEPTCNECHAGDHKPPDHHYELIRDIQDKEKEKLENLMTESKSKVEFCEEASQTLGTLLGELQTQHDDAKSMIEETFQSYRAILEKRKDDILEELKDLHSSQELHIMDSFHSVEKTMEKIDDACKFTERLLKHGNILEVLTLKRTVGAQLLYLINNIPKPDVSVSLKYSTESKEFEEAVKLTFRGFKTEEPKEPVQISPMHSSFEGEGFVLPTGVLTPEAPTSMTPDLGPQSMQEFNLAQLASLIEQNNSRGNQSPITIADLINTAAAVSVAESLPSVSHINALNNISALAKLSSVNGQMLPDSLLLNGHSSLSVELNLHGRPSPPPTPILGHQALRSVQSSSLEPTLNSLLNTRVTSPMDPQSSLLNGGSPTQLSGRLSSLANSLMAPGIVPLADQGYPQTRPGTNVKLNHMQIRCKFGNLGPGKGQFNSPHGFCLGVDEDIVVADTNNHRIQIFEKTGDFKYQFGIPGKEEGQLWYPRKVAIIRSSGKFVVCDRGNERSRMQIFTKNGHFIKKIAIRYIDIVAGLAISPQGHIVAVDSVSPTVFVIHENGDLLRWFDCSDYTREPSDIAVSRNEFFVCDFKGHCVVVFNEEGNFVRRIGYENITNFPNGIDVGDAGDILIGDSHGNRFHVAVFTREGNLLSEFECPYVKVSRCCGLKITSEGYVVTLAKNNHHVLVLNTLYIM